MLIHLVLGLGAEETKSNLPPCPERKTLVHPHMESKVLRWVRTKGISELGHEEAPPFLQKAGRVDVLASVSSSFWKHLL